MSALFRARQAVDFDGLYRHHAPSVYRYTYAVLGNHADAEDVTQQTFLNAYRACEQGTKPRKAENWLLRIAHNEIRRHFRNTQRKAHEQQLTEEVAQLPTEPSEPSLADVLRALQSLPPIQRSALVMREFEGRSYAEIAQIMGMSQSALEAHTFRARRALAEQLEEAFTCGEAEEAVLRRLDRRLPRRIGRRLKAHLQECRACTRFESVQRRQRAVLKGLSVMPIPASLFLFRAKEAAAAGMGPAAGAGAAGGSAALGGGTAVGGGGAGIAVGVAAKVAAVSAAAAVAGGVGYGVSTARSQESVDPKGVHAAAVAEPRGGRLGTDFRPAHSGRDMPSAVLQAIAPAGSKRGEAKSRPKLRRVDGKQPGGIREKTSRGHKPHPVTGGAPKPKHRPTGHEVGTKATTRPKQKPARRAAPSRRAPVAASNQRTHRRTITPLRVAQPPKIRDGRGKPLQQSA
jgi:RNA polymerase sigma-70 factor (ECF subfamily)